ncbi:hypothetical protein M422DRAFT_773668 [Sphaerobolus stellatus SS14]|nr:hypothetical protein M422DRAFT_773668 [Sphaerobolus stellatus SS14]
MDVSSIIATEQAKQKSVVVEKDIPLDIDPGLLTITDLNPLSFEDYEKDREGLLRATARDGCQALIGAIFSLPVESTVEGPLAKLPPPTTQLPRSKPLPKVKPPTKWEKFASAKGIQKTRTEKKIWDEEKQEWVNRWGRGGKSREKEEQWATPVKANADMDFDPVKAARDARKERVAKNEKQKLKNLERAGVVPAVSREERKREIEKTVATSRVSTASMGKFDKKLEGEKKLRGIKRKFDPNERSADDEKKAALALVSKLDGSSSKRAKTGEESVVNVRKAIRSITKGKGASAMASREKGGKSKGKSRR